MKVKASQRWREEEGCSAVATVQGTSSRLHGKISLDEAELPRQVSVSQSLPSLLFSALFTLPQAFSNYHWPKSAREAKDCLSLPVPMPGEPLGRYVSVKVITGGKGQWCESAQEVRADAWFSLKIIASLWITWEGSCKSWLMMRNIKISKILWLSIICLLHTTGDFPRKAWNNSKFCNH